MAPDARAREFEEFRSALRAFVLEVCEAFSRVELPRRRWIRIVPKGQGRVEFPEEERLDFSYATHHLMVTRHERSVDSLERVIDVVRGDPRLADALLVDGVGNPIREESHQRWLATNMLAGKFLQAYFRHAASSAFDEESFDAMFQRLVVAVESPVVTVTEVSPLVNARLEGAQIDVTPGLLLRKLSTNELEEWVNQYAEFPLAWMRLFPSVNFTDLDCAIEVVYQQGQYEAWGPHPEYSRMASSLVTVLRLLCDQSVAIAFIKCQSDNILSPGRGTSWSNRPLRRESDAHISLSMQQEIVGLWNRVHPLREDSPFSLALRRWNAVAERFNEDDALIDYWIALESLFAPESAQEVRYRASLRIAAFVGETSEERGEMYKDLKDSYALRSKIVHGGVPNSGQKSSVIGKTRLYLRRALLKLLSSNEAFNPKSIELKLLSK